jgi:hypothetical protein
MSFSKAVSEKRCLIGSTRGDESSNCRESIAMIRTDSAARKSLPKRSVALHSAHPKDPEMEMKGDGLSHP